MGVMATSWGDAASEVSDMDRSQSSASYDSRERVPSSPKLVGRDSAAFDRATALSGTAGRLRSAAMGDDAVGGTPTRMNSWALHPRAHPLFRSP